MGRWETTSVLQAEAQLMRAVQFRMEAAVLLERAMASSEALIHDRYVELAERWSHVAATIECDASYQLSRATRG